MFDLNQEPNQSEEFEREFIDRKHCKTIPMSDILVGQKIGKWLVISSAKKKPGSLLKRFLCRCDCGIEKVIAGTRLKRRKTLRCILCSRKEHSARHRGWSVRKTKMEIVDGKSGCS